MWLGRGEVMTVQIVVVASGLRVVVVKLQAVAAGLLVVERVASG